VSTPSDPRSGGHEPDDQSGAAPPSDGSGQPGAQGQQPAQPPQYGQQPYPQPGQYGQQPYGPPGQYGPYGQQPPPGYGQAPPYNPYAQQGQPQYGQQPGQYGQYGGQPGQYGQPQQYNPYGQPGQYAGTPFGAEAAGLGPDEKAVSRPGIMILALVLLILSAVPFLLAGVAGLTGVAVPTDPAQLPPELAPPPGYLERADITLEQYVDALRALSGVLGGVLLVLPLLYVLFAVLAFFRRNWARIILTIMTAGFTIVMLGSMLLGLGAVPTALVMILAIVAASVGGMIIMFLPEPSRWFRSAR
jgi:hypothetical protein